MKRFDQIIGSYFSPEVDELRVRARKSFRIGLITGISAVIIFGGLAMMLFISVLFQYNPLNHPMLLPFLIGGILSLPILIPTSWFFSIRYIRLCNKTQHALEDAMRRTMKPELQRRC